MTKYKRETVKSCHVFIHVTHVQKYFISNSGLVHLGLLLYIALLVALHTYIVSFTCNILL